MVKTHVNQANTSLWIVGLAKLVSVLSLPWAALATLSFHFYVNKLCQALGGHVGVKEALKTISFHFSN